MAELFTFIIVFALTVIALAVVYSKKRNVANFETARKYIDALIELKALLICIQKHRGLTTGCLHGDKKLIAAIDGIRNKTDVQWQTIINDYSDVAQESLFEGIYTHWQRLSERWIDQSVTNNIEQHNRLITNLLYLIENQAESFPVLTRFARESKLDIIWRELLETIESIGQTRAIAMGIVGCGESNAVERIQLKFLIDKMNLRLSTLERYFTKESRGLINKSWSKPMIERARNKSNELVSFIENSLLSEQSNSVSSEAFFDLASAAIEPLDELFCEASSQIKKHYS